MEMRPAGFSTPTCSCFLRIKFSGFEHPLELSVTFA